MTNDQGEFQCPRCRAPVGPSDRRCASCDQPQFRQCYCGAKIRSTLKRCPECGRPSQRRRKSLHKRGLTAVGQWVGGRAKAGFLLLARPVSMPVVALMGLFPSGGKGSCPYCQATVRKQSDECPSCGNSFLRECRCGAFYNRAFDSRCPACNRQLSARKRASRKVLPRLLFTWLVAVAIAVVVWLSWPKDSATREGGAYDQGLSLLNQGRFSEAAGEFEKWVEDEPSDAIAHRYLGESYLRDGRRGEAVRVLERARELDPDLTDAAKLLAEAALEEGDHTRAINLFEEVLDQRTDPRVQAALGMLLLRRGRVSEGVDLFEAALRHEWKPPPLEEALEVAELIRHRGRILKIGDEESRAGRIFQKALRWILAAGGGEPSDPRFAPELARVYLGLGRTKEVRIWVEAALDDADPTRQADMHMVQARLASSLGIEDEVEVHVEAATVAERSVARYADVAGFWKEIGRNDRALQTLDTGRFWIEGKDVLAMLVMWARGYARAGREAEALAGLREKSDEFSAQAEYHLAHAEVLLSAGRQDVAVDVLRTARGLFPRDVDVHAAYLGARLDLASMSGESGPEVDDLVREARAFSGKLSSNPALRSIEARALLCTGSTDLAMELLRGVHRADPARLAWALDLGRGHFLSGNFEEAANALTDALSRTAADLPQYRRMHVESLYRSGLLRRAERVGKSVVARNARDLKARWLTTRILLTLREFRAAEVEFAKLVLLSPGDPQLILGKAYAHAAARTHVGLNGACLNARESVGSREDFRRVVRGEAELRRQVLKIQTAEGIQADQVPDFGDVADFFYSLGHRDEALSLFRRELARSPGDLGVLRRVCEYFFDAWRDFTEVDLRIANLTKRRPDALDLRYLRGRRECLGGDRVDGVRLLESYVAVREEDWIARFTLGAAHLREGRAREALEHLLVARRLMPYHEGIRQGLGEAAMSEAARLHAEGTVEDLRELSRKVLGFVHVGFGAGLPVTRLLLSLGEAAGSLEVREALTDEEGARAESHRLIGALRLQRGDSIGALQSFARAVELSKGASVDRHLHAVAALRCGDAETALESARAALAAANSPVPALEIATAALIHLGRADEAVSLVAESCEGSSEPAAAGLLLALVQTACDDEVAARASLERSLEADPGYLWSLDALVRNVRGNSEGVSALQLVSGRIENATRDPDLAALAGRLLLESGEESLATSYLQKSLEQSPGHREAALLLSAACRRSGDPDGERLALAAALDRDPRDADALLLLGQFHARGGERELAMECYRGCLLARPDSSEARRSLIELLRIDGAANVEAERVAKAGLDRQPEDPALLLLLGKLLHDADRVKPARDFLTRAVAAYQGMAPESGGTAGLAFGGAVHRRAWTATDIRSGLAQAEKALGDAKEQE